MSVRTVYALVLSRLVLDFFFVASCVCVVRDNFTFIGVRVFSCSVTLLQEKCFQVFLRTPRLVLLSRLSRRQLQRSNTLLQRPPRLTQRLPQSSRMWRQLQWSSTFQLQLLCVSMWRQLQRSKTLLQFLWQRQRVSHWSGMRHPHRLQLFQRNRNPVVLQLWHLHLMWLNPYLSQLRLNALVRSAMRRVGLSLLALVWHGHHRSGFAVQEDLSADAQWCDALHNWTRDVAFGYHDDDLRVQRERPRGWRPGDAMVPAAPSSHIELAGVSAAAASDSPVIAYHRSSHVVRRWTTWYAVTRGERGVPTVTIVHELIDAPPPDWCLYSHSENHWTSVTTLQEICQFMSDKVHGEKFIMLMDLCPVHCCRDFLDWSHEALLNMLLAFVPPGMTAQLQPLDRAYMRTVKNEIRKAASRSLAHDVIAAHRSGAILQLDMRLPALRPRLVNWVTTARDATMARPEICELAWRHLTVSPIQYAAVYREACAHHDEGTLFHKIEPDPLEAECKDEEGDEIFGEPGAAVEICDPAMEPPEPVLDAAPTEEETVEQLHSLSREAKALRRCSMLKALYGSYASKGPR